MAAGLRRFYPGLAVEELTVAQFEQLRSMIPELNALESGERDHRAGLERHAREREERTRRWQ